MEKQYSLALWWWSALGLLHIWVIKCLEEKNIKIKEIAGTSMWAVVASFYALWKSSNFMIKFTKNIKFLKFLDFDLKNWLLKWDKIYKKLEEVFWDTNIEDLDIKLKIVAVNVESWEKKVFERWKIVDAIRASISLPWIFRPHIIDNNYYIDGWMLSNLPIEVLEWENVIWVSAIKNVSGKLKTRKKILWFDLHIWFFNLNFQILQRAFLLMMKNNEETSINTLWKKVIVIKPDVSDLELYSFDKLDDLVSRWYNEASLVLKDI